MRNLIAILRGVKPDEIESITAVLLEAGIEKIEIPLNSPDPFESISRMIRKFESQGVFGAGTVLEVEQVNRLADIGARLVVSPDCNVEIIKATKAKNLLSYPGVMTPTECLQAIKAGADGLKIFPGEVIGPVGLRAIRAVLPADTECLAVGGTRHENFAEWYQAGASGFGLGSSLFKPGDSTELVAQKAKAIVAAYDEIFR